MKSNTLLLMNKETLSCTSTHLKMPAWRTWTQGYSRKNTHTPEGWQTFFTPLPDWISQTARTPRPPGFPSSRTPLPPLISSFFKALTGKQHAIEKMYNILFHRSLFYYNFKSSLNIAGWISTFLKQIIRTIVVFLCKERHLSVSVPQQMYKIRNS